MGALRTATIRYAATLPPGSEQRRLLLDLLSRTAADGDKLESLFKKHGLAAEDALDLVTFLREHSVAGQPPSAIADVFTSWWGGALPSFWKMPEKDLAALAEGASDEIPLVLYASDEIGKKLAGKSKGQPKPKGKTAAGGFVMLMAAGVAIDKANRERAERDKAQAEHDREQKSLADRRHRDARARARDSSWKPNDKTQSFKRFSQRKGKEEEFTGSAHEFGRWYDREDQKDHEWACEMVGAKPLTLEERAKLKDAWSGYGLRNVDEERAFLELHDRKENLAARVREEIDADGDGDDLAARVAKRTKADVDAAAKRYLEGPRREGLKHQLVQLEEERLLQIYDEAENAASAFEKLVAVVAPDWAKGKVNERAKSKADQERAEGGGKLKAPRRYEDYVAEKKQQGTSGYLSKKEWEARYGQ